MPGERTQIDSSRRFCDFGGVADEMAAATLHGRRLARTGTGDHDRVVGKVGLDRRDVIAAWPMASLAADAGVRGFRTGTGPVRIAKFTRVGHMAMQASHDSVADA